MEASPREYEDYGRRKAKRGGGSQSEETICNFEASVDPRSPLNYTFAPKPLASVTISLVSFAAQGAF